jgi:uncharacterized membrane protein/nitrite reductase/ring-hydroxylating ferredoxin subunit
MKSKANINGHPLHPILIPFPIAFFTGTLFFDLAGKINDYPSFWQSGKYLNALGILFALLAAIPGIVDYFFTVPPASSAKKRATWHGLTNITVVVLFAVALIMKYQSASGILILCVETVGFILLCIAGYMGGTLAYRNQIGVYNRYANKGEWNEAYIKDGGERAMVASAHELKVNQMKLVHLGGKRIIIGKTDEGYVAFDDHCTHKGGSLAGGVMICGTVQCPWHGSQFDVNTGMVKAGPATRKINTYKVSEENGKIYLTLK